MEGDQIAVGGLLLYVTHTQPFLQLSHHHDDPPFSHFSRRARAQPGRRKAGKPSIRGGPSRDTAHKERRVAPRVITSASRAHFVFINS